MSNYETKRRRARQVPAVIIIDQHTLARTTIVRLLAHEVVGWDFIDMMGIDNLDSAIGMDVRLVALDVAGRNVESSSLHNDLAAISELFPEAAIALLSSTDDPAMASHALAMGVRGYFTTSLPIEIAIAGIRLVLAGGIFCPNPLGTFVAEMPKSDRYAARENRTNGNGSARYLSVADFTPREADVLAELQRGHPNKVIAGKLNLSGNTVKMHLQHIMRKLNVQNRTEVVARLGQAPSTDHEYTAS
ncbi:response regulator transcription factor [Phyllobacterium zundukense]|uniref:Response regulator transcription factor n=1 Tax=Phyllobacterium zundukense TaxID=1867719 RepID=A0ACD4D7M0_9HYPH|nr:response regulator transcription factor [Phyllobacterium zundukense]UXN61744.1 response regulator transcription factor [Phyllobacterium zundukense]